MLFAKVQKIILARLSFVCLFLIEVQLASEVLYCLSDLAQVVASITQLLPLNVIVKANHFLVKLYQFKSDVLSELFAKFNRSYLDVVELLSGHIVYVHDKANSIQVVRDVHIFSM